MGLAAVGNILHTEDRGQLYRELRLWSGQTSFSQELLLARVWPGRWGLGPVSLVFTPTAAWHQRPAHSTPISGAAGACSGVELARAHWIPVLYCDAATAGHHCRGCVPGVRQGEVPERPLQEDHEKISWTHLPGCHRWQNSPCSLCGHLYMQISGR